MLHASPATSVATCVQKRCTPGLYDWNPIRHRDQPGAVLGVGAGTELVEPAVVERPVGVGEVSVRLGQVVPVQLAEVLEHGTVGPVHRGERDRLRRSPFRTPGS